jgi:Flp pilus assembly protein TadB
VQASQTGGDEATVTLKVPSDKLEGVLGQIRGLGKVTSESESGDDVTAEYIDLQARISHWQAQEAVFVGLMEKAKTIPETIQIQQQLSTIQEQIEQLQGRQKYLDGQTSYSTVRLTLLEEGAVAKPEPGPKPGASTLGRAWHRSAGAALAVLGGTLVVLGVAVPLAAVIGIPAWLLALVLRRRAGRPVEEPAPAQG